MCRGSALECTAHQDPDGSWSELGGALHCDKLGGVAWAQKTQCLFDLQSDPREMHDIAEERPERSEDAVPLRPAERPARDARYRRGAAREIGRRSASSTCRATRARCTISPRSGP